MFLILIFEYQWHTVYHIHAAYLVHISFSIDRSDVNSVKEVQNSVHFVFNVIIARYVLKLIHDCIITSKSDYKRFILANSLLA